MIVSSFRHCPPGGAVSYVKMFKVYSVFKMESNSNLAARCQELEIPPRHYPVDQKCEDYKDLNPEDFLTILQSEAKSFILPNGEKVKVTQGNVGQLMLFGDDNPLHCLQALHKPGDETQVVALYLHGQWWSTSDVLKTSSTSRNGLVFVESVMERVILFLLSQIVFGVFEKIRGEQMYFSAPPMKEYGKILWLDGEAVGFYTVKKKGSLCDGCTGQTYHLPVLDTVFVRSQWRRRGLAFQMLEDFCTSMPSEKVLGISYPISPNMYGVCKKYLENHHEERDRLYEVEAPGEWSQRRNVWLNILLQPRSTQSVNFDERPNAQLNATGQEWSGTKVSEVMTEVAATSPEPGKSRKRTNTTATTPSYKKAKISL